MALVDDEEVPGKMRRSFGCSACGQEAIKFTPANGSIKVVVRCNEPKVAEIIVSDTWIGIAPGIYADYLNSEIPQNEPQMR